MKKRTKTLIGLLAVVAFACLILLAGCAPADDSESIEDVINKFVAAVNEGDLITVKECLDPAADDYSTAVTDAFFLNYFGATPFTITSYAESGTTATVELTPADAADVPLDLVFTMVEGDDTYYITTIEDSVGQVIFE